MFSKIISSESCKMLCLSRKRAKPYPSSFFSQHASRRKCAPGLPTLNRIESVSTQVCLRPGADALSSPTIGSVAHYFIYNFSSLSYALRHPCGSYICHAKLYNPLTSCNTQSYLFTRSLQSKPLSGLAQQFWRLQACCKRSLNCLDAWKSCEIMGHQTSWLRRGLAGKPWLQKIWRMTGFLR